MKSVQKPENETAGDKTIPIDAGHRYFHMKNQWPELYGKYLNKNDVLVSDLLEKGLSTQESFVNLLHMLIVVLGQINLGELVTSIDSHPSDGNSSDKENLLGMLVDALVRANKLLDSVGQLLSLIESKKNKESNVRSYFEESSVKDYFSQLSLRLLQIGIEATSAEAKLEEIKNPNYSNSL